MKLPPPSRLRRLPPPNPCSASGLRADGGGGFWFFWFAADSSRGAWRRGARIARLVRGTRVRELHVAHVPRRGDGGASGEGPARDCARSRAGPRPRSRRWRGSGGARVRSGRARWCGAQRREIAATRLRHWACCLCDVPSPAVVYARRGPEETPTIPLRFACPGSCARSPCAFEGRALQGKATDEGEVSRALSRPPSGWYACSISVVAGRRRSAINGARGRAVVARTRRRPSPGAHFRLRRGACFLLGFGRYRSASSSGIGSSQ